MSLEIEGKWLPGPEFGLKKLTNNPERYNASRIKQGYIAKDPNGNTVRVRLEDDVRTLTVKGRAVDGAKPEHEQIIDVNFFEGVWTMTEGRRVEKTRYRVPLIGQHALLGDNLDLTAEVDVFGGLHAGLVLIEVEVPHQAMLDELRKNRPSWFGVDVTNDPTYSNSWLAENGMPHPESL